MEEYQGLQGQFTKQEGQVPVPYFPNFHHPLISYNSASSLITQLKPDWQRSPVSSIINKLRGSLQSSCRLTHPPSLDYFVSWQTLSLTSVIALVLVLFRHFDFYQPLTHELLFSATVSWIIPSEVLIVSPTSYSSAMLSGWCYSQMLCNVSAIQIPNHLVLTFLLTSLRLSTECLLGLSSQTFCHRYFYLKTSQTEHLISFPSLFVNGNTVYKPG